jgi:hypothetical protein
VTAAGPLRGPPEGGGCAAARLVVPAEGTGPPLRPQGCCASRCARRPAAAPDPGDLCGPWRQVKAGRHSLPPPGAGTTRRAPSDPITATEVSTVRGEARSSSSLTRPRS